MKNVLLVNAPLTILFLSDTYGGRMHDKRIADATPYPLTRGEPVVAGPGLPGVHAAPGRDPHADQETAWPGTPPRTATGQPGPAPASAAHRACPQQCEALSHRERPDPPVEGGRPRCSDGTFLCSTQLPGAPHALAADDLIGINSNVENAG